jgi:RNA-directed DNA polymerase
MEQLGLTLNAHKTCLQDARTEPFDFLGYTFGPERYRKDGHGYLAAKSSKKAVSRLKGRIREVLCPGKPAPWPEVVTQRNRTLAGWANYFSYGTRYLAYWAVDHFVYQRVLGFLQRRHKVSGRGTGRLPRERVFGELGALQLRSLHVSPT